MTQASIRYLYCIWCASIPCSTSVLLFSQTNVFKTSLGTTLSCPLIWKLYVEVCPYQSQCTHDTMFKVQQQRPHVYVPTLKHDISQKSISEPFTQTTKSEPTNPIPVLLITVGGYVTQGTKISTSALHVLLALA